MQEKLEEFLDFLYGFRKLIAFLLLFIVSIVFRLKALIDGGQFVDLMKNVSLAFFAANGVEHFTGMVRDHLSTKLAMSNSDNQPINSGANNGTETTSTQG